MNKTEQKEYIEGILEDSGAVSRWMRDYAAQMILVLLGEEVVIEGLLSSGVHSPGPGGAGLLTITCKCFDFDGEYRATGHWLYNMEVAGDPMAHGWELYEIDLEDVG